METFKCSDWQTKKEVVSTNMTVEPRACLAIQNKVTLARNKVAFGLKAMVEPAGLEVPRHFMLSVPERGHVDIAMLSVVSTHWHFARGWQPSDSRNGHASVAELRCDLHGAARDAIWDAVCFLIIVAIIIVRKNGSIKSMMLDNQRCLQLWETLPARWRLIAVVPCSG